MLRNGKIDAENILKKVSEVSEVSEGRINKDDFISWYADTFSDKDKLFSKLPDTSDGLDTFYRGGSKIINTLFTQIYKYVKHFIFLL